MSITTDPPATQRAPDPGPLAWPALAEAACAQTKLSDFGDEAEFRPALDRLLEAWREEAQLNEQGHRLAWARTLGSLKNRLWTESCLRAHPEIETAPMAAPLVLVGAQGSGATGLHRLLACDTRLSHLRAWEALNPAPRLLPAWPPVGHDVAARQHEVLPLPAERPHTKDPQAAAEDALLLNHGFAGLSVLGLYDLPGWWRWFAQADHAAAYRALARQLRLVAWSRGDAPGQRWLMKASQHMLNLPALQAAFPGAQFVFTQRAPALTARRTVATMVQLSAAQTDRDCSASVRDTWLSVCETAERRCVAARRALPGERQLELHHAEMVDDWRATLHRVQRFAGLGPDADTEVRMQAWLATGGAALRATDVD